MIKKWNAEYLLGNQQKFNQGEYMTNQELAQAIKVGLFADRGTDIRAALDYAYNVAQATDNPAAVMTAVHVVLNTVANAMTQKTAEA